MVFTLLLTLVTASWNVKSETGCDVLFDTDELMKRTFTGSPGLVTEKTTFMLEFATVSSWPPTEEAKAQSSSPPPIKEDCAALAAGAAGGGCVACWKGIGEDVREPEFDSPERAANGSCCFCCDCMAFRDVRAGVAMPELPGRA